MPISADGGVRDDLLIEEAVADAVAAYLERSRPGRLHGGVENGHARQDHVGSCQGEAGNLP